jgi:L-serine deaminase
MIDKYIKTDVEGLVKDPVSGAVLNVNTNKLEAYRKQKQLALKASTANDRLDKVENDINDIKQMLQQLLKR